MLQIDFKFNPDIESILFIDEAQESKQLGAYVRSMKEQWHKTHVILTGSSISRLFSGRFPVGRVEFLELQSFSFFEFLDAIDQTSTKNLLLECFKKNSISAPLHIKMVELFSKYLNVGGLPAVVTSYAKAGPWQKVRDDLLLGYQADFRRVFGDEKASLFMATMKATAHLLGQPFKQSYIKQLLELTQNTPSAEALSQLEMWKIIKTVPQHGPKVESHFHPKIYLFDVGIARTLRQETGLQLDFSKSIDPATKRNQGGFIEAALLHHLWDSSSEISGWKKSSSGTEIDFVIKKNKKMIACECKSSSEIKSQHLTGVLDFLDFYNLQEAHVFSFAPWQTKKIAKKTIHLWPIYLAGIFENF